MDTLRHIEIEAPRPQRGLTPVTNFWIVRVVTQRSRLREWEIVLQLADVLDALKTLTITDDAIEIDHPVFKEGAS